MFPYIELFGFASTSLSFMKWLGIAWLVYIVCLSIWIVLQKRAPASTLSWIFRPGFHSLRGIHYLSLLWAAKTETTTIPSAVVENCVERARRFPAIAKSHSCDQFPFHGSHATGQHDPQHDRFSSDHSKIAPPSG